MVLICLYNLVMNVGRIGEEYEDECGDQCGDSFTVVLQYVHDVRTRRLIIIRFITTRSNGTYYTTTRCVSQNSAFCTTILDKIVETHERSYVIFGRSRIILFAPPPTPQFNVVDMIPMLRTCGCRIMSTLNWGRRGLQQKLRAFKSVERGTRILSSKFQCVSTRFVQDCRMRRTKSMERK